GLSYVAQVPFVLLDLRTFESVTVDLKTATAWVDSGVTNGKLYYEIGTAQAEGGLKAMKLMHCT
ncbi:hypothetical protein ACOMH0_19355, partial [Bacillus sp. YIM B13601]|uniref:hypothetical protein n=1 Tax=Bacillus sp. YIM B13601 TaxID=3366869 RepID=UPI003B7BD874